MSELNFAVIDVETTGLFAKSSDRILEIAVLRLSPDGQILERFETLVNPSRDVGPTYLHGITAGDVVNAPSFGEIAGDVLARLRGSVLVGHNVNFDYRFLETELKRLGVQLPDCMRICTMYIARRLIPMLPSRSLCGVCSLLGIDLEAAHTAMSDATATGQLLIKILEQVPVKQLPDLLQLFPRGEWVTPASWPNIPTSGKTYPRTVAAERRKAKPSYIASLVNRLPTSIDAEFAIDPYIELLDRMLEDRLVSIEEQTTLETLCKEFGISRDRALQSNRQYMRDLVRIALSDGIITEPEKNDLDEVALLLGIPEADYQEILSNADTEIQRSGSISPYIQSQEGSLRGKSVCFTGEMRSCINGFRVTREEAHEIAYEQGLTVHERVTKALDILVVTDPNSVSIRAKKAHQYGIRVIAEPVFWKMLDIVVD